MQEISQTNRKQPGIFFFNLIHISVCLTAAGYYLIKFSGTRLLGREGELLLNTLLIVIIALRFFVLLNRNRQNCSDDGGEQ